MRLMPRRLKIRRPIRWPKSIVIEELFNNDNGLANHVHVASQDRKGLVMLARIAKRHYADGDSAPVREFPPFDLVEDVHTNGSWHYRDSHSPLTPRNYSNRGDGLAFDLRSGTRERFAAAVKKRYPVKECDF